VTGGGFTTLDWVVVLAYLALALGVGLVLGKRSRGSMENFFLSGRSLPWWLAGTSMVATSFASDTPLVVSSWTRTGGVAGNWRWWCYVLTTLLVVVVFARLWRRSEVLTDVEFMELRYSGRPARGLRAFKSVYQTIFMHCFVMGWVILGMTKVLVVLFDMGDAPVFSVLGWGLTPAWLVMLGCSALALLYSEVAGLWGVVATDFVQFFFALTGSVVLMLTVIDAQGGLSALVEALNASPLTADKLASAPDLTGVTLSEPSTWTKDIWQFAVFLGVMWFANKNSTGSGVEVQRILACRNEKHALGASLWYAVAHYAIRPWPWILVALASLLVLPPMDAPSPVDGTVAAVNAAEVQVRGADGALHTVPVPDTGVQGWQVETVVAEGEAVLAGQAVARTDDEKAYPLMMRLFLPAGLLGLLAASFLAAFMSTIDTHVNVASSYLVNDLYRRFLRPDAPPKHYVRAGRIIGPVVMLISLGFAAASDDVRGMFDAFTALFGGVGVVYLLRWLWWRINAWSEVAALLASAATLVATRLWPSAAAAWLPEPLVVDGQPDIAGVMLLVVGVSVAVIFPVTLLTPAVDREQLVAFYERVRPPGFWGPVRGEARGPGWSLPRLGVAWIGSVALVMVAILLPGDLLLQDGEHLGALLGTAAAATALLLALSRRPSRHAAGEP